jgi:hypothetical protein
MRQAMARVAPDVLLLRAPPHPRRLRTRWRPACAPLRRGFCPGTSMQLPRTPCLPRRCWATTCLRLCQTGRAAPTTLRCTRVSGVCARTIGKRNMRCLAAATVAQQSV